MTKRLPAVNKQPMTKPEDGKKEVVIKKGLTV